MQKFVEKANSSINDGALCIIFTDDDSSSISAAVEGMKQRKNVFWQIIAYEQDVKNIKAAIKNRKNISVVSLFDYQNKTDKSIEKILSNYKNLSIKEKINNLNRINKIIKYGDIYVYLYNKKYNNDI